MSPFELFVASHVVTGAAGLALFWGPVATRKGSANHRAVGKLFVISMLATGLFASGMSLSTLIAPIPGHHGFDDPAYVRGVFGWLMLYLAALTVSLAWHAIVVVRHKTDHAANRAWPHLLVQAGMAALALNCTVRGVAMGEPLMIAMPAIGLLSAATNFAFIFNPAPDRSDYLREHIKAGIGAGISVYTAFLAFGLVRLLPDQALNPAIWAIPTVIGVSLILYHWRRLPRPRARAA